MNPYELLRPLLFKLEPERAHRWTLNTLNTLEKMGLLALINPPKEQPIELMGLRFPNRVGLAGGMDRHAEYFNALGHLGFGFIEVGTLTQQPQMGQPRPRLFRLVDQDALINRMGFYNKGIEHALPYLEKRVYQGVLGISIGKQNITPVESATNDYCSAFTQVYSKADYIAVNVSSPNTQGLRALQHSALLDELLGALKDKQKELAEKNVDGRKVYVPLVVKIAPDLSQTEIQEMAALFLQHNVDGVIASNTSLSRDNIAGHPLAAQAGGLSGRPITQHATQVLSAFQQAMKGHIPLIASGGIMSAQDARDKFNAGASLVQLYTGLIYRGPRLIAEVLKDQEKQL